MQTYRPFIAVHLKNILFIVFIIVFPQILSAQTPSTKSKLSFESDFRFRIEEDWSSKKSDGTYRTDRTRLRYRLRTGFRYEDKWYSTGFRIRTGNPNKQQDPQLTLGEGFKEFGTLPIGLEKAYFQGKWNTFDFWIGKNTFPFEKNNELFWSDNVFPEGVFGGKGFSINSSIIDTLNLRAGHFIMSSKGQSLNKDAYIQGIQAYFSFLKKKIELFPSLYLFKNVPNIPDSDAGFDIDYSILHIGTRIHLIKKPLVNIEFDYYNNLQNYDSVDAISTSFKDQKSAFVIGLKYGKLKQTGDWTFAASYAYLQQYAAVDYMAQNDWARWDYSSYGSPDGRLTNLKGIELVGGYAIDPRTRLIMKYYLVEQLIPYGAVNETGSRVRLDIDIKY